VYRYLAIIAVGAFGSLVSAQGPPIEVPSAAAIEPLVPTLPGASGPTLLTPSLGADLFPAPSVPSRAASAVERLGNMYKGGFVLVDTADPEKVPFYLRLNAYTQFRYLNQQLDSFNYTDHLGNVRTVDPRNDFNLNRQFIYFSGFVLDPKLVYSLTLGTLNSIAFTGQGGFIGYEFDKAFKLYAGYWGMPGSRTLTRNFMFLPGVERSMADTFFRPGFTQGIWAEGEPVKGLNYTAFVGNSLNTIGINTAKLDTNFVYSGSVWCEPLGDYGPPGPYRTAFSDLENHESPVARFGTSFTGAREDRFSNIDTANPENASIFNSDGTLFFAPGSLSPGVTVQLANYYMWAQDVGFKYRGFSFNGQYFQRWLNSFRASGPLPINKTFDHGFEASTGFFVVPKKVELYGRTSSVFGEFRDSNEYGFGVNWHPWGNRNFRVIAEASRVNNSPVGSIITPYTAGMSGWNFVLQTQLFF
jgi:hypothetical protein